MKKILSAVLKLFIFIILTILTQIGGLAFLMSEFLKNKIQQKFPFQSLLLFIVVYACMTFLIVPFVAPFFGREKVKHSENIQPATYMTIFLNRNYVRPQLNTLLADTERHLKGSGVTIRYLDANFPFINKFPLLPHLSHNDGKKIDLGLVYETSAGEIKDEQKSVSGYGVYEDPLPNEPNQPQRCINNGYVQYDFPKYLTLGRKNSKLQFSKKGTRKLLLSLLKNPSLGKIFLEPHLKARLKLKHSKIRYHGCRSVRHDDHIHIQL